MFKSAYNGECLSRTSVFEWHKKLKKKVQKVRVQKLRVKTMMTAFFFYAKGIIHHEFVPENRL
jgi:hypothetical protein